MKTFLKTFLSLLIDLTDLIAIEAAAGPSLSLGPPKIEVAAKQSFLMRSECPPSLVHLACQDRTDKGSASAAIHQVLKDSMLLLLKAVALEAIRQSADPRP
mmetsp:Transcript_50520/g.110226  ORF Transcript_50520/g.110226 Transcript_50520/m.110226 type:complete len:101 (-) Transcript_50520:504-806(-)